MWIFVASEFHNRGSLPAVTGSDSDSSTSSKLKAHLDMNWNRLKHLMIFVCFLYASGFCTLVAFYLRASFACSNAGNDRQCILDAAGADVEACISVRRFSPYIMYYQGFWSLIVVVIFTTYALLLNGFVFGILSRGRESLSHSQLMLLGNSTLRRILRPLIPFELQQFRELGDKETFVRTGPLRSVGIKLSIVSILSFAFKVGASLYVAIQSKALSADDSSVAFMLTTVLVEILPCFTAISLLGFFFHKIGVVAGHLDFFIGVCTPASSKQPLLSGTQHEVDGSNVCEPSLSLAEQQPKTHLEVHLSQQLADRDAEIRRLQQEIRALKHQS